MADKLDELYNEWWRSPRSNPPMDDLLKGVRAAALKQTHDEDIAQAVCLFVTERLATFCRADETAFSRWIRSIIRRTRLEQYRTSSHHTRQYDETAIISSDDLPYINTSQLPAGIKIIADKLLEGWTFQEIADMIGISNPALRNRLMRFRKISDTKSDARRISK